MELLIRGINTYYIKEGNGEKTLLMLHGWGADHSCFRPVIDRIRDRYTIYAPDLPGFGKTPEPDKIYDVFDYAAFIADFMRKLGIVKPVVIGHSNGGRIAIALAQIAELKSIVLADSAGIKPNRDISHYINVYTYKLVKNILLLCGKKGRVMFEKYRQGKGSVDYRKASDRMKEVMKKLLAKDLRELLPGIRVPVLLFWGEKDTATPLSDAKLMERLIKDSGLVVVKGGGHFSYLDDLPLFVKVLDKFMEA